MYTILVSFVVTLMLCNVNSCGSSKDNQTECEALVDFANALDYKNWKNNTNWLSSQSVCDWAGIKCSSGRVKEIKLNGNKLKGTVPASIGNLAMLKEFNIEGTRPDDYKGCTDCDLQNTSLPSTFFQLDKMETINLEYCCLSGGLDGYVNFKSLVSLQIHGNWLSGTIPSGFDDLTELTIMKLGRNPIHGTVPAFKNLHKLLKFNCNFCAVTGQFPDIFDTMPALNQAFWDGNGLTGTLPSTISKAKNLTSLSFNINDLSGVIDDSLCDNPPKDCRIGSDTDDSYYDADYPWLLPCAGNLYKCPLPKCAQKGGVCYGKDDSFVNCTNS